VKHQPEGWMKRGWSALILLLIIAIGARVIYGLLAPLLPFLGAVVVLAVVYMVVFRGWRR
jgi:uncharacterized protein (DUF2062 family)